MGKFSTFASFCPLLRGCWLPQSVAMSGSSRTRTWLILLAIAAGVLAYQVNERSKSWTARSKADQLGAELLAAQTPEQAAAIARELGSLDEAAAGALTAALASEEPFIS